MDRVPPAVDPLRPSPARVYDYLLGGKDNFDVDRRLAELLIAENPGIVSLARENRRFLVRAVRFLTTDCGIRQFLDIGSGLPTRDNVHAVAPEARVVYVDNDPMVSVHGRALLASESRTEFVEGDLRRPEEILASPGTRRLIDFGEPVALLLTAVLHFVPDTDDPHALVARLGAALPPGSRLVLTHGAPALDEHFREVSRRAFQNASERLTVRHPDDIQRFFDGWAPEPPGLVPITDWRPSIGEVGDRPSRLLGGVARKL